VNALELAYAGAAEQARLVRSHEISAAELVHAALAQIERHDPLLNAFRVVLAEEALESAQALEADGALLGVPVAIKDDTDVAGEVTTWGTAAHGPPAQKDSPVVARLRKAGAIVIGKTNVPELDLWAFTESKSFGKTSNPWNPSRTPGGSSGGSAVAAATGMAGVGHGTDGTGSARNPAAWTGLVGLKTQRGRLAARVGATGWRGMVVHGALGRHVVDVAAFLDAASGEGFLAAARQRPAPMRIALTLKPPPGSGAKLGDAQRQAVLRAAQLMRDLGHRVEERDPEWPRSTYYGIDLRYIVGVADDAGVLPAPEKLEVRTRRVAGLGRSLRPLVRLASRIEAKAAAALDELHRDADLLLFPGSVQGPPKLGEFDGRGALYTLLKDTANVAFQPPWNLVGRPALMLPAGFDYDGLPLAVQLGARPGQEAVLLSVAAQLERALEWQAPRPPLNRAQPGLAAQNPISTTAGG
jgi:amidase